MIKHASGNLLEAEADALVNTVNTVGVMGKGIALQFKKAFPGNFRAYKRACDAGEVELGKMFVWDAGEFDGRSPRFIVNFPTKQHWRSRSRIQDIETGLDDLVKVVSSLDIGSIAIPPLGCGNGGLEWSEVEPIIVRSLARLSNVDILLFSPDGAPAASEQPVRTERPKMTPGRAALVGLLERYLPFAVEVTHVDIQKLMYFLQEAGEPLRLRHVKGQYGPYADGLRHVLNMIEGHFISGVGDGTAKALQPLQFEILPGTDDEVRPVLDGQPETTARIERVTRLIEGFESTYGLELLATTHWAATRTDGAERRSGTGSYDEVRDAVRQWNRRKGSLFLDRHIQVAYNQLNRLGWFDMPEDAGSGLFANY